MAHGRMGERPCAWRRRGGSPRAKIQHRPGHPKQRPGHQNRPRGGAGHRVFRPCAHGPWPLVVYYYIITPLFYIIILFYVFSTVRFYSAPWGIILHRAELFCSFQWSLMGGPISHSPIYVKQFYLRIPLTECWDYWFVVSAILPLGTNSTGL